MLQRGFLGGVGGGGKGGKESIGLEVVVIFSRATLAGRLQKQHVHLLARTSGLLQSFRSLRMLLNMLDLGRHRKSRSSQSQAQLP